jgi:hypothetical protein
MSPRVKVFTYISGSGSTVIESTLEDQLNSWLGSNPCEILEITQSESERPGVGHHVTVCVWYFSERATTGTGAA